ncbi:hypothetical protein [Streptomyces filamentosus]|uniref:hypothetical protein n=1 Tax=Streptomyces filamentosus TaxID=67294 RepID=UPI0033FCF94B
MTSVPPSRRSFLVLSGLAAPSVPLAAACGGVLKRQVDAGPVEDLTDLLGRSSELTPVSLQACRFEGRIYGGSVRHRHGRLLVQQEALRRGRGRRPPATWAEFPDVVGKLKAAGVTPIALAGKGKWPGHSYRAYLAMRVAGLPPLQRASTDKDFTGEGFVRSGAHLKEPAGLRPFRESFLGAGYATPPGPAPLPRRAPRSLMPDPRGRPVERPTPKRLTTWTAVMMLALTTPAVVDPAHPAAGPGRIAVDFRAALQPIDGFGFSMAFQRADLLHGARGLGPALSVTAFRNADGSHVIEIPNTATTPRTTELALRGGPGRCPDACVTDETRSLTPADAVTTRGAHLTAKLAPRAPTPLVLH